jgi:diguanylate cyclase (GGDEF)-like protein/PAS domain S-box-containing protein
MREPRSTSGRYDVDRSATVLMPDTSMAIGALMNAVITYGAALLVNRWAPGSVDAIPLAIGCTATFLIGQEGPQRALGSGSLSNRVVLRVLVGLAGFAVILNSAHVGFLLPLMGVPVAAVHVQWSGSKAWKPILRTVLAVSLINQLLLVTGLLPSVLNPVLACVVAAFGALIASLGAGNIGITTQRREEVLTQLTETEARFRTLVQNSSDVVLVAGADGVLTYVSPASEAILHIPPDQLEDRPLHDLVIDNDITDVQAHLAAVVSAEDRDPAEGRQACRWESRMRHAGPGTRWLEFSATDLRHDPVIGGIVVHVREVTQRRQFQDQLAFSATHDPLTGLSTRDDFVHGARERIARARPGASVALLFCDLDRFKAVNDTFGHAAGDEVLIEAARRLRSRLRAGDLLGRIGGDEFTVCLANLADPTVAERIADDLRAAVSAPFTLTSGDQASIGVSIGVSVVTDARQDADAVLQEADQAMYSEKHGRPDSSRVPEPRPGRSAQAALGS